MSNLKKLSISLVLLSCFAVTSKVRAMDQYKIEMSPYEREILFNKRDEIQKMYFEQSFRAFDDIDIEDLLEQLRDDEEAAVPHKEVQHKKMSQFELDNQSKLWVVKNVARVSREGLKEEDMKWICGAIAENHLGIHGLNLLIKFGLSRYVNSYISKAGHSIFKYPTFVYGKYTILNIAIASLNPEIVKRLVSVGAEINEDALISAIYNKEIRLSCTLYFDKKEAASLPRTYQEQFENAKEITHFLLSEKAKLEAMPKFTKNLLAKKAKKFSDVRIHCLKRQKDQPEE